MKPSTAEILEAFADLIADRVAARIAGDRPRGDLVDQRASGLPVCVWRAAIKRGDLPASKVGTKYLARRADLDAFIAARAVKPKARTAKGAEPAPANDDGDELDRALAAAATAKSQRRGR